MNLSPEEKEVGKSNFYDAISAYDGVRTDRRDFLKSVVGAGVVSGAGLGAMWYNYGKPISPVRIGVIGTGDEGNVLIGGCSPDYVKIVAIADIRPSSIHRAFHGDYASPAAWAARPGIISKQGYAHEDDARKTVKVYDDNYLDLLDDPDVEAVIIALPLHLHAEATVAAMKKGKHVLCEKLMAHNIAQCKVMSRVAKQEDLLLAVGHQRHYNILYDNAVQMLRWGLLGQIHHIRAQWHRGNLPGRDSWAQPVPGGEKSVEGNIINPIADKLKELQNAASRESNPKRAELLKKQVAQWAAWDADKKLVKTAKDYGYLEEQLTKDYTRSAIEELVRWRLWDRTGGGLMAELGSHQLDASSIFISALREDGKKSHPLSVHAVGGRNVFPYDRDSDDHVYCTFEFPGPEYEPDFEPGYYDQVMNYPSDAGIPSYEKDPNKKIVVTYSSINGNGYGGYGEVVMGTKGTLVLEKEKEVMIYKDADTATKVGVKAGSGGPTMDTQASGGPVAAAAVETGPVSRGYTEQIEHWAWCIRNRAPENMPRCKPEIAVADAVLALTAKQAMANNSAGKPGGGYIEFKEEWFDIDSDETPDGSVIKTEGSTKGEWDKLVS
ncbi:MAG: Gfo/Idh/MocA family oxidoreductase [bacterium]|nr:Gfo/Idh/MocA family oxidoreductase [bacterium]